MSQPVASNLAQALQEALTLHRQGKLNHAERIYNRIIKVRRDHFDALHLLGLLKHQSGKAGEAYRLITAALAINPRSADALSNLGMVLHALKRDADALASFDRALALEPAHVEALNNRGTTLLSLKRADDALTCLDMLLALQPRHVEARVNRANALLELGRHEEAVAGYDAVLAMVPVHPGAHYNRGSALLGLDRPEEAIAAFDRALASVPDHAGAWNNRGIALRALNRNREAIASYGRALTAQKDFADAHLNEALALLTLGDFRRGFEKNEWRWKTARLVPHRRTFRQPLWLGTTPIGGKTILVYSEQGFGDAIHFARYAALLARAGARVVLEVPPVLKEVLSGLEGEAPVFAHGETLPAFDVHCPLVSLALAFKTEIETIPAQIPYIAASAARLAKWQPLIDRLDRPRVAVAWSGNPAHANDRNRSIALARLDPLLSIDTVQFVSIQRDLRDADRAALAGCARLVHVGDKLDDFADTAAVMALADIVVCVDSAAAHLAGAMGRPVWIMLPFSADWRWMLEREDNPWYPTARLFRQPSPGDWASVVERVRGELIRVLGSAPA